jgi:hypothetical protein
MNAVKVQMAVLTYARIKLVVIPALAGLAISLLVMDVDVQTLMNVLTALTAVIKSVQTLLEATLVHVTLAIVWRLTDKRVMVSPLSCTILCEHIFVK